MCGRCDVWCFYEYAFPEISGRYECSLLFVVLWWKYTCLKKIHQTYWTVVWEICNVALYFPDWDGAALLFGCYFVVTDNVIEKDRKSLWPSSFHASTEMLPELVSDFHIFEFISSMFISRIRAKNSLALRQCRYWNSSLLISKKYLVQRWRMSELFRRSLIFYLTDIESWLMDSWKLILLFSFRYYNSFFSCLFY